MFSTVTGAVGSGKITLVSLVSKGDKFGGVSLSSGG